MGVEERGREESLVNRLFPHSLRDHFARFAAGSVVRFSFWICVRICPSTYINIYAYIEWFIAYMLWFSFVVCR